jgi:Rps23 Pro-64 3,4-dihydroxylase Tpa1-like proline 4-hydroxylase
LLANLRLTLVWYIHDEPKAFTGGDLLLHDDVGPDGANTAGWFTRIVPVRNMALMFPSADAEDGRDRT